MDLVPVVEITLSIFTGLLILALIISYVSSRFRKLRKHEKNSQTVNNTYTAEAYISNSQISAGYPAKFNPLPADLVSAEQPPVQAQTGKEQPKKFTVLNDVPFIQTGYIPENAKNSNFAAEKTKETFSMFK